MHDPGDECECSECRVRAIWPAEQVTRDDTASRIIATPPRTVGAVPTAPTIGDVRISKIISDIRFLVDTLEDLLHAQYSDNGRP